MEYMKKESTQIKSSSRVRDHGEVLTHEREVKAMLDLVQTEDLRNRNIEARYLEPACGDGNFLIEILRRKLNHKTLTTLKRQQRAWEMTAIIATGSIYGVDILPDNVQACRNRLYNEIEQCYLALFKKKADLRFLENITFILNKNIIAGDAREFTDLNQKPIIFSQWQQLNNVILRKDYHFEQLANGNKQAILDKEFLAVNYLLLNQQQEI